MAATVKKKVAGTIKFERFTGTDVKADRIADLGFTESNIEEDFLGTMKLATGQTNVQLSFGPVTKANIVAIESDEPISIKIDSTDPLNVAIKGKKFLFYHPTAGEGITTIYVSNSSGNLANIEYLISEIVS